MCFCVYGVSVWQYEKSNNINNLTLKLNPLNLKTKTKLIHGFFLAKECNHLKTVTTNVQEGTQQTQHLTDSSTNDSLGCCRNHSTIITTFLPNPDVMAFQYSEAHGPQYHPLHSNNVEPLKTCIMPSRETRISTFTRGVIMSCDMSPCDLCYHVEGVWWHP